jgi:protease-4
MASISVLLQAINRPWFIDPTVAQKYAAVVDNIFAKDGSDIWQNELVKPVSKDFAFAIHPSSSSVGSFADAPQGSVALISISGAIMKYDFCGAPGTQSMMAMIDAANASPNIDAIVLEIDSPGGAVDGTAQLANKIKSSSKPVVAYVNGMMASAAMWFGSAASYRVASSVTDMIGSIGTMASWRDTSKMQKAAGVRIHEVYATRSTDKNNEFRAANADEPDYQPMIDNILDPTNEQFIAAVKGNIKNVNEEVFTGAIYLADKAKEMGLINQIGTREDAVNKALQLANKNKKTAMEQNQRFAATLAATGAESFDMLNEGIWLTEAQLEGIELALNNSATALQEAQQTVAQVQGGLTEMETTLQNNEQALTTAQNRIKELEASLIAPAAPVSGGDSAGGEVTGINKYKTSVDAEAEKLRALHNS